MQRNVSFCVPVLCALICTSPAVRAGDDVEVKNASNAPTVVWLLQNSNNVVQLGAPINGQFSYPFTFASDPPLTNGLKLSASGIVSGGAAKKAAGAAASTPKSSAPTNSAAPAAIPETNKA